MIDNQTKKILILIACNTPVFLVFGRLIFGGVGGFFESFFSIFKPTFFSAFFGEYWEDRGNQTKFVFFLFLCAAIVASEYLVMKDQGWFF